MHLSRLSILIAAMPLIIGCKREGAPPAPPAAAERRAGDEVATSSPSTRQVNVAAAPTIPAATKPVLPNPVFVDPGDAKNIVYICDATGTMKNRLPTLKRALVDAIDRLSPEQSFNVLFFTDGGTVVAFAENDVFPATKRNRASLQTFLQRIEARGTTNPRPAILAAYACRPDVIYFLTDGELNGLATPELFVELFKRGHAKRAAAVHTVLYEVYAGGDESWLKDISNATGGRYRFVREKDAEALVAGDAHSTIEGALHEGRQRDPNAVFADPDNATCIIYICDTTGTMKNRLPTLKRALVDAIDRLSPEQSFNVLFFTDGGKVIALSAMDAIPATAEAKAKVRQFVQPVEASGTTNPMPAIRAAYRARPDLIYFVSDGEVNSLHSIEEHTEAFRRRDPEGVTPVNMVLFDTYDQQSERWMRSISDRTRGKYWYVTESDVANSGKGR